MKMKHKKERCTHSEEVKIDEVAESLPVNVWFDRVEFSIKTGIKECSCYQRLRSLVSGGYLEHKPKGYRQSQYRMSLKNKLMMIERAKLNILNHGAASAEIVKEKPAVKVTEKQINKAEIEAYKEQAERILRSIKFI